MNVTYEKKDAMTFIGYHTEIRVTIPKSARRRAIKSVRNSGTRNTQPNMRDFGRR